MASTNTRAHRDNRQGEERAARPGLGFGDIYTPLGFVNGQVVSEYADMQADIARTPRRSLLTSFRLLLAGEK